MKGVFSRLVQQSSLYAIGNVILKVAGLILLPLYLNLLTEDAFGHFALLDVTGRVLILIGGLGLSTGLLRFMSDREYESDRPSLPFTSLTTILAAALVIVAVVWAFARPVSTLLLNTAEHELLVRLMAVYAAFKIVESIPLMLLRIRERVGLYVAATAAEVVVLIGAVLLLFVHLDRGLAGIFESYALSAGIGMIVLVGGMLVRVEWSFRWDLVRPLIRFGLPLVWAGLAALALNVGDRYLLKALTGAATVGIYDWAARLGGAMNMLLAQSFQLAFNVIGLKVMERTDVGATVYRRVFRHFAIWAGWAVLGLSLLAYDFTRIISTKSAYLSAETLVLPIALGFMLHAIYLIHVNVLLLRDKTRIIAVIVFGAALGNIVLNLALIPLLGAMGAALATLVSYALLLFAAARASERQIKVGYAWGKLIVAALLVVGLYGVGHLTLEWSNAARLAARIGLIAAYAPLAFALGLYTADELRLAFDWVRTRLIRTPSNS